MLRRFFLVLTLATLLAPTLLAANQAVDDQQPGFFRFPDVNNGWVVFTSEGDLWKAPLSAEIPAIRLTTAEGEERFPHFSPDGKWIAYSGQEDGNDDVYVIPSGGGQPRRLTFHPERDQVVGWDPDGNILFRSMREFPHYGYKIYRVSKDGSFPENVGLYKAAHITYEPNGKRVAFTEVGLEFRTWKRYQGGWAEDVWVGDIGKKEFEQITESKAFKAEFGAWEGNCGFPMWHTDGRIYFLSDRSGRANIWSMKPDGSGLKQHTGLNASNRPDFDARFPEIGGDLIVYQLGMDLWALNLKTGDDKKVPITLPTDRTQARTRFVDPKNWITDFELTPDAKRLMLCSRGELFTVPTKKDGLIRQLTFSSGVREKFPRISPDGKTIACWSDADAGEEHLYLYPIGGGDPTLLGSDTLHWHFPAIWSPDGKSLLWSNEAQDLMVMDVASKAVKFIDHGGFEIREYAWSPDSRYVVYGDPQENYNQTIKIWDSKDGKTHDVTDNYTNSHDAKFSADGKYLFFLGDKVSNPRLDGYETMYILDERTMPYCLSLKQGIASPFAPVADPDQSDDDHDKGDKDSKEKSDKKKDSDKSDKKDEKKEPVKVEIDFDGLADRIAAFPVSAGNYFGLAVAEDKVFYCRNKLQGMLGGGDDQDEEDENGTTLIRFDLKKKKASTVATEINGFDISQDLKKIAIQKKGQFIVQNIDDEDHGDHKPDSKDDDKVVDLSGWDLRVNVRAEWQQIYNEAWRLQRDFFWDPYLHRVDWLQVREHYKPLSYRISTRDELNDLIGEIYGELNCSHTYVGGGDYVKRPEWRQNGLLGVDVSKERNGFYRIDRVLLGRPWDPSSTSPLAASGIDAKPGDYIVAIDGQPVTGVADYAELLLDKAGKSVAVKLNSKPSLDGAREVVVKALGSERPLRHNDWVDGRRKYVEEKSKGTIGYIHLSDMGGAGLSQFAAAYLPQHDKKGLVLDVRYNGGGFVAEMILSHLARGMFAMGMARHGLVYRHPSSAFHGYMAAVSNGETGSDGETFTEGFRRLGLGPIFGTRTWGGWIGIRSDKPLMDGAMVTQPEFTGWGVKDGKWMIEGWGTDPDVIVVDNPGEILRGKDPSLDYTINYLLDQIKNDPKDMKIAPMPPFPTDRAPKKP